MVQLRAQTFPDHGSVLRKHAGLIQIGNDARNHFTAHGLVDRHVFLRRPGMPNSASPVQPSTTASAIAAMRVPVFLFLFIAALLVRFIGGR
jgi:hypothetical protein